MFYSLQPSILLVLLLSPACLTRPADINNNIISTQSPIDLSSIAENVTAQNSTSADVLHLLTQDPGLDVDAYHYIADDDDESAEESVEYDGVVADGTEACAEYFPNYVKNLLNSIV